MLPGSVKNFELPNFDDKSGLKEWELFGDLATYINDRRIDVENIKLDIFDKDNTAAPRAVITSPKAQVDPSDGKVFGDSEIFVKGEDFNLDGKVWRWDSRKKFMEILDSVKIDFRGQGSSGATKAESDTGSLDHGGKRNIFTLSKNVRVKGDDLDLKCQKITLTTGEDKKGRFESMDAEKNVFIRRDGRDAEAQSAIFTPAKELMVLKGNPKITDVKSGCVLLGDTIMLDKKNRRVESIASPDKKLRATAVLLHKDERGKEQSMLISADSIKMESAEKNDKFTFSGDVKITAPDFTAKCMQMTALSLNADSSNPKIQIITGSGNVRLANESGNARADNFEIIPDKDEILLIDNCELTDPKKSSRLKSHVMIFKRKKNNGIALSNPKEKNSLVNLFVDDGADISAYADTSGVSAKKGGTTIKSRKLNFAREGEDMAFTFFDDVSINSGDIDAKCQKMTVFTGPDSGGKSAVQKITADRQVQISQSEYTANAETAVIYPKLKTENSDTKKPHKFVELGIAGDNPGLRPQVTLPPLGNIGLNDPAAAKAASKKNTVITSDKQWLASAPDADRYYFEGDVRVDGTDMNAECGRIEVVMKPSKGSKKKRITQIIMTDSVKLTQGLKEAECGRADIYADEEMIVLSQDPVVFNREDNTRASGFKMVYNRGKGGISIEGSAPEQNELDDEAPKRPTLVLPSLERVKAK